MYFGLLSNKLPTLPVYKNKLKWTIPNNPSPNSKEPTILFICTTDKYTQTPMVIQKPDSSALKKI